jgi:small-conductance mechanosensitive channel/CRP-like cAMP-binding protein
VKFALEPGLQTGLFFFLAMTFFLLVVLRLTRQLQSLREKIKGPLLLIYLLLTVFVAFYILNRPVPDGIRPYILALLYLSVAVLVIRFATLLFFDVFLVRRKGYRAPRLLKEIAQVLLFTLALVFIIQNTLRIQVTTLLATSALITVVVGLALQETLGNLFAGLALQLDPAYQPGDWIHAGESVGRVEEVTWRATKLRTTNNDLIIIPNGQIAKEKLTNHSFPKTPHAILFDVGVAYSVPPNKVDRVVKELLATVDNVAMEPAPEIRVASYNDFAINYKVKFFFNEFGRIEPTLAAIKKGLWYHFKRNDIEIPFPVRDVYLHGKEEVLSIKDQRLRRLADSLLRVYLFASLDEDERLLIAEQLNEMHYAQKELIIREGERDDSLFIIGRGEVEVFITSTRGNRKILSRLVEGDFFGEMALLTGEKRTASVQAITDVRVYQLDKSSFREVLERKPDILEEISNVLSRRKDELSDLMSQTSSGEHPQTMLNVADAKNRILSRIRDYFGL